MVSDASRHREFDGSGAVVQPKSGEPTKLALGITFGMSMKLGVPYSTKNTVIEFERDKRIAWQTVLSGPLGRFIGGRIWRYDLAPTEGGTKVTESWDITQDKQKMFLSNDKVAQATSDSMTKSLEKLSALVSA